MLPHMSSRPICMRFAVVVTLLQVVAPASGCRRCSPQSAVGASSHAAPEATGEDSAAPPSTDREPTAAAAPGATPSPQPAVDSDANGTMAASYASSIADARRLLTTTDTPLERVVQQTVETLRNGVTVAGTRYLRCTGVRTPGACARLLGVEREHCDVDSLQIAARQRADRNWVMVEPIRAMFRQGNVSDADSQRFAEAVETGTPALCDGLPAALADCRGLASGDPSICARTPGADRSCGHQAAYYALVRRGIGELAASSDLDVRALGVGAASGPDACEALLRDALNSALGQAVRAVPGGGPPTAQGAGAGNP